jgi:putative Holliday junction resolvase
VVVALGLDVGERRIGVAVGDATGTLATPITAVIRTSDGAAITAIGEIAAQWGAVVLVVGLPLGPNGEMTAQAERIHAFGRKLRVIPGAQVVFWDESFSTATASELLAELGQDEAHARSARQREAARRRLDAAAAAVLLQGYLDRQRRERAESP